MAIQELTVDSFSQILQENKIVLIDFWAAWCAPCRNFALTYHDVAEKFPEIKFTKVNIDDNRKLATDFNIRSIPHLMIFKGETELYSEPGALNANQLIDLIKKAQDFDVNSIKK
jgi:thioredoxin 1